MFKRIVGITVMALVLGGCSTIQQYWPRAHDPQMVQLWVITQINITRVDCAQENRGWGSVADSAEQLALYTEFRKDPQATNMRGLARHAAKMNQGGSKVFCELGKKTAEGRLSAARTAWEGR